MRIPYHHVSASRTHNFTSNAMPSSSCFSFGCTTSKMTCRNISCFAKPNRHHLSQKSNRKQYSSSSSSAAAAATKRKKIPKQLERPEVIYSNNHLLVVNKPAGWKSQPGNGGGSSSSSAIDPKCLLTYLKSQSLGGGSNKDFLIPTHRLDQPCTGVLIFAKNGKAASRVQFGNDR